MVVGEGMRAVSIRVNDVVGVAGFLLPGNRVDVVAAYKEHQTTRSETVVQNVKVLAVDQTASTDKNEPVVVRAVTLEVTPEDAEKLVLAEQRGTIQLALRNPSDSELVAMRAPAAQPTPVAPPGPPTPAPKAKAKPRVKTGPPPESTDVTVIRGTNVGKETPKQ
jgi:pilus assembly protein CpaB